MRWLRLSTSPLSRLLLPDDVLHFRSFLLPLGDRHGYISHLKQRCALRIEASLSHVLATPQSIC